MIDRRNLLAGIGGAALPFVWTGCGFAQDQLAKGAPAGKVADVRGTVTGRRTGTTRPLSSGNEIFVGERLQTLEASRMLAELGPATKLYMGENTRLMIDRHLVQRGGTIHLASGALMFDRKQPDPKPPIVIQSPYAMIAVRGTTVFAGPSNGVFGILVLEGLVEVKNAGGSVTLRPGQGTNIAKPGARPTAPATWGEARINAALSSVR